MAAWLAPLIGAVAPALIGGLVNRREANQSQRFSAAQNVQQRQWEIDDYLNSRADFARDRAHNEALTEADYQRQRLDLAEQVASRGIDFGKLRDQAQAAGFNPLSVLGNAGAYSTEKGMALGGGGGGGAGFSSGGRGFSAATVPAMASGSFIQEALERGIDTVFNSPPQVDPLAEGLRAAHEEAERQREAENRRVVGGIGRDLTEEEWFEPAVSVGLPPVSRASQQLATGPQRTEIYVGGNKVRRDGVARSSAADFEDEYGDVAGAAYGMTVLAADAYNNWKSRAKGPPRASTGGRARYNNQPKISPFRNSVPQSGWMDDFFR